MEKSEIESIGLELLLEAIYRRYGHDFRGYSRKHLERRVGQFCTGRNYGSISELIPAVLHDEPLFEKLLREFSIIVTEMFRDPLMYRSIRKQVVPILRTFPFIRIWVAGCATGEEAYSIAILLEEEDLYDRCTIFGTDFNDSALEKAKEGIYPADSIKLFTENYQRAGGEKSFSEYYHAEYEYAVMAPSLKRNMIFANHNLSTDHVFGDMHLVLCRNVLIYFDRELQDRALSLFSESLVLSGILCLGSNEDIRFTSLRDKFRSIDYGARIFQKTGG
jgi:chemotaxis protein methyltransferase CheR